MKKYLLVLLIAIFILPNRALGATAADAFVPELRDTQLNSKVSAKNIRLEQWITNLPKDVKATTLKSINTEIIGEQTGVVSLAFKDGSTKEVEIPVEVITPFVVDEGPVRQGVVIDPLDRVKNIPRGWKIQHKITASTKELGKQTGKNRNQINFTAPGITTVLLRFWLEVVEDVYKIDYQFTSKNNQPLPKAVLDLLPKGYRTETIDDIQAPQLTKTEISVDGGKWQLKGWEKTLTETDAEKTLAWVGTWGFEAQKEDKKSEEPKDLNNNSGIVLVPILPKEETKKPLGELKKAYIQGYPDGSFKPEKILTRAEATALIARLMDSRPSRNKGGKFVDVEEGSWYAPYVYAMEEKQIVQGYGNGRFLPEKDITRAELVQILIQLDKKNPSTKNTFFKDTKTHWAAEAIHLAYENHIVRGYPDGNFKPNRPVTRSEAVAILNNYFHRKANGKVLKQRGEFNDISSSHWAYEEILLAVSDILIEP